MCGLVFKKLDKKSEKQFLFRRRQELCKLLQETSDPRKILNLVVALIFQKVKNMVVMVDSNDKILDLLCSERKVDGEVAKLLRGLAGLLDQSNMPSPALLQAVKECGLGKTAISSVDELLQPQQKIQ